MKPITLFITIIFGFAVSQARADLSDDLALGMIYSVDYKKNIITVTNIDTGHRHTYFINEQSKISSQGDAISIQELQRGQAVAMDFKRTDSGRVIDFLRVPNLDNLEDIPITQETEKIYASGAITGIRSKLRYIVIRGPRIHLRRSLYVPTNADISMNGKPIKFSQLRVDDLLEVATLTSPEKTSKDQPTRDHPCLRAPITSSNSFQRDLRV